LLIIIVAMETVVA